MGRAWTVGWGGQSRAAFWKPRGLAAAPLSWTRGEHAGPPVPQAPQGEGRESCRGRSRRSWRSSLFKVSYVARSVLRCSDSTRAAAGLMRAHGFRGTCSHDPFAGQCAGAGRGSLCLTWLPWSAGKTVMASRASWPRPTCPASSASLSLRAGLRLASLPTPAAGAPLSLTRKQSCASQVLDLGTGTPVCARVDLTSPVSQRC